MQIKPIRLRQREFGNQWAQQIEDHWNYADFLNDPAWRKEWTSFDCLCHDPQTDTIFAGLTSFDADIFWGWNRRKKKWLEAGYARIRDPYDAKFHRSLLRDSRNGCLYAATALLHDIDQFWDAPGGSIIKYNPNSGDIAKLAIPMPHVYIQSMILDEQRDTIYGQTFTPENLVSYDLAAGTSRWIGPTSSGFSMAQGENIILDDDGCVWGVWSVTRAWQSSPGVDQFRFYKFDPRVGKIQYMDKGLPRIDGSYGYEKPEGFFNLGTGCLYISGAGGALYRMDPKTAEAEFLFKPIEDEGRGRRSRMAAMCMAADGLAYSIVGRDGECEILRFSPKDQTYQLLGPLVDPDSGAPAWQVHDICATPDGTLYAAETDNPQRSSYLWEIVPG